jgi:hypothetical protein
VIIDDSVSSIDRQGVVYSITFSAASAGQTLTVRWLLEDVFNPNTGDFFLFGHVGISSATLDGQPVPLTPSVTSIQPNPANPGQVIAISGNSFGGATGAVNVGGVPAQVISWSDSEIQAVVPTAACGGPLVVFANGLSSSDAALTINQPLAIIPQTARSQCWPDTATQGASWRMHWRRHRNQLEHFFIQHAGDRNAFQR